ncbi:putative permease YjgP/YjgQ family protein [Aliarcobacter thereius]|uniref:LptF/LptG family permease n=1 Tax=Aliarcobacter thereius TaxID=544718 RepID=UPI000827F852|nr:LptF/LptG family permease [Aliarcobacter thereius]OCL87518.1 putative permease YjgP/YjgQ family protein [Aliarcobacter thereius]
MKLNRYLHTQLSLTFFPIFLGLFFITSVVFLVKIASLTSVITMSLWELITLFSYSIPQIVFYTLPITFFISLAISVGKLSSEYELTVITSFGLNPLKILKIFLPITVLMTAILLVISLGLIPKTKYLTKTFMDFKKKEANFNIKESEFGQKFGEWLIYISSKDDKTYKDVKLFKTEKDKEQFIISKQAHLINQDGNLSFKLESGKVFIIDNKEFNQIDYENMYINDAIENSNYEDFKNSYKFWKNNLKKNKDIDDFTFFILTSIFPLISLFLVVVFGYFNPRYEKNKTTAYAVIAVVLYYILIKYIGDNLLLHSIYIIPIIWIIASYILYSKTIKKEY